MSRHINSSNSSSSKLTAEQLEAKLAAAGYIHPDTEYPPSNSSSHNPYASYGDEKGYHAPYFSSGSSGGPYATDANAYGDIPPPENEVYPEAQPASHNPLYKKALKTPAPRFCPVCNDEVVEYCECDNSESICNNGHFWYVNNNGQLIRGNEDELHI